MEDNVNNVMTIEEQIERHFSVSPTVPFSKRTIEALMPLCIEAIKIVNNHDMTTRITLPEGCFWTSYRTGIKHSTVAASEFIRIYGLDIFLDSSWEQDE